MQTSSRQAAPPAADHDLVKLAYRLTANLSKPKASIYWIDLVLSAAVGHGALAVCILARAPAVRAVAGIVAALALYRGIVFIHELAHLRRRTPRYFWIAWHLLIGVPMMLPAFFYEGIHNQHHSTLNYGTEDDPEYMPLASLPSYQAAAMVLLSALIPLILLGRYLVLAPLSVAFLPVRQFMLERVSGLVMSAKFRRRELPQPRVWWLTFEVVTTLYVWTLIGLTAAGIVPVAALAIWLAVWAVIGMLNTLRTLVAHHYTSEGEPMSALDQLLDSVNVPPPALLPMLWAPVGLRYHGLHHLLPNLPYHNLGAAHRRLLQDLPAGSLYRRTLHARGLDVMARLLRSQAQARALRRGVREPTFSQ